MIFRDACSLLLPSVHFPLWLLLQGRRRDIDRCIPQYRSPHRQAFVCQGTGGTGIAVPPRPVSAPHAPHPPQRQRNPGWKKISWEEALDVTAFNLKRIAAESGAEAVSFCVTTPSGTAVADGMAWIFRLVPEKYRSRIVFEGEYMTGKKSTPVLLVAYLPYAS